MKKLLIIALAGCLLASCKKNFEKVNTSPNASPEASPGLLFNSAAVNLGSNRAGGDVYDNMLLCAQTISSGGDAGWGAANVYDISPYSTGNTWKTMYSSSGLNLKTAIQIAENSDPVENGAAAQCKVLLAEVMYTATMIWGDVPYSEAWQAEAIPYPHFDKQQDIFNSLLNLLDEAINQMGEDNAQESAITSQDLFYGGDLTKWQSLAKSMKFRILMTMVDKDPSKAADIQDLITSGGMLSAASDNFMLPFGSKAGNQNPKYALLAAYAGGTNLFFFANTTVLNPMVAQNDPRLPRYFDLPEGQTDYVGIPTEELADPEVNATISMYLYRQDAPEVMFSYQEQLFLEAEAYARGFAAGGISAADEKYKAALQAACEFYEADPGATSDFVDSKSLTTVSNPVDEIHLQQWIDFMDRPLDAFNNWRRSGPDGQEIPHLTLPPGATAGPLMRRWLYPSAEEISPNPNAPKEQEHVYDKLWFDL